MTDHHCWSNVSIVCVFLWVRTCPFITLIRCLEGLKTILLFFCISISKVLSEWVSQWQGHLLSCSGQLKTTCVASIHGNEFASALPKYFSEQRGGRLKVLILYLKSLQYCNLCLLLLTSPHRRSQRSSQVDHLSWWKSKYNFCFRQILTEVKYNFFRRTMTEVKKYLTQVQLFSSTPDGGQVQFFSSELTEALFLPWDVWVGGSSSGNKKKSN